MIIEQRPMEWKGPSFNRKALLSPQVRPTSPEVIAVNSTCYTTALYSSELVLKTSARSETFRTNPSSVWPQSHARNLAKAHNCLFVFLGLFYLPCSHDAHVAHLLLLSLWKAEHLNSVHTFAKSSYVVCTLLINWWRIFDVVIHSIIFMDRRNNFQIVIQCIWDFVFFKIHDSR